MDEGQGLAYVVPMGNNIPGLICGFHILKKAQVIGRDSPFLYQSFKVNDPGPVFGTKQNNRDGPYLFALQ